MISLIIPHCNQLDELLNLLRGIRDWELKPDEIVIVDSSVDASQVNIKITSILQKIGIKFQLIHQNHAYPGAARNIGIRVSKGELLAFLDVKTIPQKKWLASAMQKLSNHPDASGIYGGTQYVATTYLSKTVRLATYGVSPLKTLPGSLLKRDVINITGQFIESTRAGEDTDWMARLNLHKLKIMNADSILNYNGLDNLTLPQLLGKWYRNYKFAAKLPYQFAHKNLYYHALVFFLLLVAFNWNWIIAGWNQESNLYIPHFTKIIFILIVSFYIYVRGILMPMKKGASWSDLLPLKWLYVAVIGALLDVTKILAFARGRWMRE